MQSSFIALDGSSGADVHRAIDEQIVRVKRAILQHFLGNGLSVRISRGPYDRDHWYVPLEGCNHLKDGEQPRANDVITRYPACTVQAVLGPCTRLDGPWASLCLDADDADGVDWVQRHLGGVCTVWERTPHGAHFYYIYRLGDAPNGVELPKCERLNIDAPGAVDLRTHGVCCTLTGSLSPKDGTIYGPWMGQWAFRALDRDALSWLASLTARQKEAEVQPPTITAAVAAPTTPPAVHVIDLTHHAAHSGQGGGASFGQRLEAAIAAIEVRASGDVASQEKGGRNDLLNLETFNLCRAYREQGATALPYDVAEQLVQAAMRSGLPEREARDCIRTTEIDVFQRGKGRPFSLQDRPYTPRAGRGPKVIWLGGAA